MSVDKAAKRLLRFETLVYMMMDGAMFLRFVPGFFYFESNVLSTRYFLAQMKFFLNLNQCHTDHKLN